MLKEITLGFLIVLRTVPAQIHKKEVVNNTNTVVLIYLYLHLVSSKLNISITFLLKMLYSSLKKQLTDLNCSLLQPNPIQLTDNSRGSLVTAGVGELMEMELVALR